MGTSPATATGRPRQPSNYTPLNGIKHWGNNLGVHLPAAEAREANFHADQRVRVSVVTGRVIISPIADASLSLEQRLPCFDPARHGGEVMVGTPRGAESW